MTEQTLSRPPFDPELEAALSLIGAEIPSTVTPDMLAVMKQEPTPSTQDSIDQLTQNGLTVTDATIPGHHGDSIIVTAIAREGRTGTGPGIYYIHGGGMVTGDRFLGPASFTPAMLNHNAVVVTVEYRLAPEFPDPYPVEDCYAGLIWTADHAAELGIDVDRLIVAGGSAGGGLSAGTVLLARDRKGPALLGQVLMCPMLDDRNTTVSSHQIDGVGVWDRTSNLTGWSALLGDRRGTDDVSIYAAPARATDLSGLPSTYIDCGSVEVFRDEDVAYASALWAAGVQAELHVWAGGFHGFEMLAEHAAVSAAARQARESWIDRLLRG